MPRFVMLIIRTFVLIPLAWIAIVLGVFVAWGQGMITGVSHTVHPNYPHSTCSITREDDGIFRLTVKKNCLRTASKGFTFDSGGAYHLVISPDRREAVYIRDYVPDRCLWHDPHNCTTTVLRTVDGKRS